MARRNQHLGSSFDDFLEEGGIRADVEAAAIKRVVAHQIAEEMRRRRLSKQGMAAVMGTSRSALDRLLDPANTSVTLRTLERAAQALHRRLKVELV